MMTIEKRTWLTLAAAALIVLGPDRSAGAAHAGELQIPKAHPLVVIDLPDNWIVARSSSADDLRSPEKDSIVVAGVALADKMAIDDWTKQAMERLKAFGIQFAAKAPPTSLKTSGAPAIGDQSFAHAFATGVGSLTFASAPPPDLPSVVDANVLSTAKMPFRSVQINGASLGGKKVDVQILIYFLPGKRRFLMLQESGGNDGRAVAIAKSVRPAKAKR